jgi:hypothetical protein
VQRPERIEGFEHHQVQSALQHFRTVLCRGHRCNLARFLCDGQRDAAALTLDPVGGIGQAPETTHQRRAITQLFRAVPRTRMGRENRRAPAVVEAYRARRCDVLA